MAAEGVEYMCDWINDDMPYPFHTESGDVVAMPHQHWISDATILFFYKQSGAEFVQQVKDQFDALYAEAGEHEAGFRVGAPFLSLELGSRFCLSGRLEGPRVRARAPVEAGLAARHRVYQPFR